MRPRKERTKISGARHEEPDRKEHTPNKENENAANAKRTHGHRNKDKRPHTEQTEHAARTTTASKPAAETRTTKTANHPQDTTEEPKRAKQPRRTSEQEAAGDGEPAAGIFPIYASAKALLRRGRGATAPSQGGVRARR